MSTGHVLALGAIAGLTIFLGLPIGRLRARLGATRTILNAVAVGILVFLLWDILAHAWAPIDTALTLHSNGTALIDATVLTLGFTLGFLGLVWFDQWIARRAKAVATDPADTPADPRTWRALWSRPAGRLSVLIAGGIGLHNFAEGLAIGNSAVAGELSLAWLLVIGFATHNATEGFGIVAPLSAAGIRPSWLQLFVLGVVGGGPTIVGTLVGSAVTTELVGVGFLALAAGSILYVVIELLAVARRFALKYHTSWGLLAGLVLGFATDAILTASGS
jgi:ZIP family zinc transporter